MRLAILLVSTLLLSILSCSTDGAADSPELVGTWQLRESYADPGDGSGTFRPVSSDKVLVFRPDGTFRSNKNFCVPAIPADQETTGSYSTAEGTLTPDCAGARPLPFELQGETLELSFHCIEGCGERYRKVSDAGNME
ncbi:lipocalin family protein [Lewinella sp. IMCC34191]|uniref:lipocalin family protein n=1 Tax=Lewinella sp. IMCC34191 TaxID=2259172 RepID=UPI000E249166|nr:lipocalin family protein [Lewinella sp. IMCC34191]